MDANILEDVLKEFVNEGYTLQQMIDTLSQYDVKMSLATLKRKLQCYGLGVRRYATNWRDICELVRQSNEQDSKRGYRQVTDRLLSEHGIRVRRFDVMKILQIIDPNGAASRRQQRLVRREYSSPGVNYCWHMDGNDKLKPFGISIHGCIDGLSRKILWLKACVSNKNPAVVAWYFKEAVEFFGVIPCVLRTDRGSENVNTAGIQEFLGGRHVYGSSILNQRIEALWAVLMHRGGLHAFRTHFKQLLEDELFSGSEQDMCAIRLSYMALTQRALDNFSVYWNSHRIRRVGRPNIVYRLADQRGKIVETNTVQWTSVVNVTQTPCLQSSNVTADEYFNNLIESSHINFPHCLDEAKVLYLNLRNVIPV